MTPQNTPTTEDNSLESLVASLLTKNREKKRNNIASANAVPKQPIENNPWILQGLHLLVTTTICQHCATTTEVSHGLVECYRHKTKGDIWETPLIYTSLTFTPDTVYLGKKHLSSTQVNGCPSCIDQLTQHTKQGDPL